MYTLLILFFISLMGIVAMIGRKLSLNQNSEVVNQEYPHPFVPDLQKIKHFTLVGIRKYGHLSIVIILRLHIRSTNFLKNRYEEVKTGLININNKVGPNGEVKNVVQVSKFLKMISDYKYKIRELKHQIHKEEEKKL
jgi:hypothetical protein